MLRWPTLALAALIGAAPLQAHEFWIEPDIVTEQQGSFFAPIVRIGEEMRGREFPFKPDAYERVIWSGPEATQILTDPAELQSPLRLPKQAPGVHVFAIKTYGQEHIYGSEQSFERHVRSLGLKDVVDTTDAGIATGGKVIETYRRFSKTLVRFDDGENVDQALGFEKEWVRTPDGFQLLSKGSPVLQYPAFVYCKSHDEPSVEPTLLFTDDAGLVTPISPKGSACLINSVFLKRQADGSWSSDWVSIHFSI